MTLFTTPVEALHAWADRASTGWAVAINVSDGKVVVESSSLDDMLTMAVINYALDHTPYDGPHEISHGITIMRDDPTYRPIAKWSGLDCVVESILSMKDGPIVVVNITPESALSVATTADSPEGVKNMLGAATLLFRQLLGWKDAA